MALFDIPRDLRTPLGSRRREGKVQREGCEGEAGRERLTPPLTRGRTVGSDFTCIRTRWSHLRHRTSHEGEGLSFPLHRDLASVCSLVRSPAAAKPPFCLPLGGRSTLGCPCLL